MLLKEPGWPNITYAMPASFWLSVSALYAPIITSLNPSALTSPAALTENPLLSFAEPPLIRNPLDKGRLPKLTSAAITALRSEATRNRSKRGLPLQRVVQTCLMLFAFRRTQARSFEFECLNMMV